MWFVLRSCSFKKNVWFIFSTVSLYVSARIQLFEANVYEYFISISIGVYYFMRWSSRETLFSFFIRNLYCVLRKAVHGAKFVILYHRRYCILFQLIIIFLVVSFGLVRLFCCNSMYFFSFPLIHVQFRRIFWWIS